MKKNLNPFIILRESYNSSLYDYFQKSIYPKIKNTSTQVARQMFLKKYPNFKITGMDDSYGFDIEYVDPESKTYRAYVEGVIDYKYRDEDDGSMWDDGMYYHVIVFFNLNGWYKLARIYLGS